MSKTKRSRFFAFVPAAALLATLAGCGGDSAGGSVGGTGGGPDISTTALTASQTTADSLVADMKVSVTQIRNAQSSANVSLPLGVQIDPLPTGASTSGSLNCSQLYSGGTGSISYKMTYTGSSSDPLPQYIKFTYKDCSFTVAGYTFTLDGTGEVTWTDYTSLEDTTYTLTTSFTDMHYVYSGSGINDDFTLNTSQTCDFTPTGEDCHYSFGHSALDNLDISTSGSTTTIRSASIDGVNVDISFSNWVWNSSTGRATSGTVTITAGSNTAVITVTSTGYDVAITVGGTTTHYTVAF